MAVRIRTQLKALNTLIPRIEKKFSKEIVRDMGDAIVEEIVAGKSPVRGEKFEPYSAGYAKSKYGSKTAIKPVNMLVRGKMLESINIKRLRSGLISIKFTNPLATIHNSLGAGKGKVKRRLLPTQGGEEWNKRLTKFLNNAIESIARKEAKQ